MRVMVAAPLPPLACECVPPAPSGHSLKETVSQDSGSYDISLYNRFTWVSGNVKLGQRHINFVYDGFVYKLRVI
jgi:hypothetical protein